MLKEDSSKYADYKIRKSMLNLYYPVKFDQIKNISSLSKKIQNSYIVVSQETYNEDGFTLEIKEEYWLIFVVAITLKAPV